MDFFDSFTTIVLAVMAVILLVGLYGAKKRHDRLQVNGLRTQGVVVRNKIRWGKTIVVQPVVSFTTHDGRVIETLYEHGVALAVPRYPKGATVTILYDKMNPHDFDIIAASRRYI